MEVTHSLSSVTETSITMAWNCDNVVDYLWYSKDGGSKWTGVNIADAKSGTYTISGLNANARYSVKTRVCHGTDTAETSVLDVKTYSYPYCSSLPSFTVGDRFTLGFYNPLGRRLTAILIGADGSEIDRAVTTTENVTGFDGAVVIDRLLQSIPDSKSGSYSVNVIYDSNSNLRSGGTYTVSNETVPDIQSASYEDTNSNTIAITQNNQLIIQNQSIVDFSVTGLSAGTAASIVGCSLNVNGDEYSLTISEDNASVSGIVIDNSVTFDVYFTVTDSRGMTFTKPLSVTMLPWALPTAIIQCQRQSNYYSSTDINVNADFSSLNGANTIEIKVRYKKTSEGTYGAYITLQDGVTSVLNLDNGYEWDIQVLVTDVFGSTTYNIKVSKGTPIWFVDREKGSVGVNCFPQNEGTLEVSGVIIGSYTELTSGDLNDVTVSGYYYGHASNLTNCPVNSGDFLLTVHNFGNSIMQRYETVDKTSPQEYKRFYYSGSFGAWI